MNQQSEIFSKYRSLFNSKSIKKKESETSKRIGNLSFVDFLFELVKATKGQQQFKNIILKGSLSKMKNGDAINKSIINSLLSQYACDNTLIIPRKYTTNSTTGIEIDKAQIDSFGILGINPDETPGKFLYEGNDPTKHVNYVIYKAQGVKDIPLIFKYKNNTLFSLTSSSPNTFTFKFGELYENKTYKLWLTDYLAAISPIFNFVNFTTILTDLITGAVSIKANKNKIEVSNESKTIKTCQKLFGFCSDSSSGSDNINNPVNNFLKNQQSDGTTEGTTIDPSGGSVNSNVLIPTFEDLADIEKTADLRSRGVVRFSTCGDLDLEINPDDIMQGLAALFTTPNNSDLNDYSNGNAPPANGSTISTTDYDNTTKEPNLDQTANFFDDAIKNGATKALNSGETNIVIDLPNINAELQLNILKAIPYAATQMILSPKLMIVPKLYATLTNQDDKSSSDALIKSLSPTIKKAGTDVSQSLIDNIFQSIKSDISKLATDLAKQFISQRGKDYLGTLLSLISLINLGGSSSSGCSSVLSKLLSLLKLSNFGPMTSIPSPLILVGGALKPGMNSVSIINDVKSNLNEKGIETAPYFADGTQNSMMIVMEEIVKTMTTHIKNNSKIQTYAIGASGPVQGFGQIQ